VKACYVSDSVLSDLHILKFILITRCVLFKVWVTILIFWKRKQRHKVMMWPSKVIELIMGQGSIGVLPNLSISGVLSITHVFHQVEMLYNKVALNLQLIPSVGNQSRTA
jgi:hypothetical protein